MLRAVAQGQDILPMNSLAKRVARNGRSDVDDPKGSHTRSTLSIVHHKVQGRVVMALPRCTRRCAQISQRVVLRPWDGPQDNFSRVDIPLDGQYCRNILDAFWLRNSASRLTRAS